MLIFVHILFPVSLAHCDVALVQGTLKNKHVHMFLYFVKIECEDCEDNHEVMRSSFGSSLFVSLGLECEHDL